MKTGSIYKDRREKLLRDMGTGVALLKSAPEQIRTNDTEYPYRQDSDFFYLTGYAGPGAACILDPNNSEMPFTLFVLPQDPKKEVWTGWRLSFEETQVTYGADQVLDIAEFEAKLAQAMPGASRIYTNLNHDKDHQYHLLDMLRKVRGNVQRQGGGPEALEAVGSLVHEMRLIKDSHEIEHMQRAADISAAAHVKAMEVCLPGLHEYQLQAVMESHFVFEGGSGPAYPSIVGSGNNATTLHYVKNRDIIKDGDLILIDAATEYEMYAADITRTFPANGKFTDAQRDIYQIVLRAQKAVIDIAAPGVTFQELHDLDLRLLVEGMVEIGLLTGTVDEIIANQGYQDYFMHRTGHWLGLDVHDMGNYMLAGKSRILEPGMVFTVEPGIYVNNRSNASEQYRGIGIRIEDDILITENGHLNLTAGVPKEIAEIEALMLRDRKV